MMTACATAYRATCAIISIHWRCTTALIAKLVIFRYFISTHRAKHVKIIKLNAQVNNKWQKSGKSTVAHAIMAPFKIFGSAHAQPEFFRAVMVIPDVCKVRILFDFEFCFEYEVNIVSKFGNAFFVHIEMCFYKLTSCVASLEMCCGY